VRRTGVLGLALETTEEDEACDDDRHREGEETKGASI